MLWRLFKKLNVELPYDPAIPHKIHLKECKSGCNKDICISMFVAALFTKAKLWKWP
jgi:hypothetical protein